MAKTDMEQQAGSRVTQWEDLSDKQRAGLVKRYGEPKFNGEHDFFSKDMTTGISPPPIGITNPMPAINVMPKNIKK